MSEFKPKVWMACPLCGKKSPMPDPDHREWQGLTDEEKVALCKQFPDHLTFNSINAIEARLKEKNT